MTIFTQEQHEQDERESRQRLEEAAKASLFRRPSPDIGRAMATEVDREFAVEQRLEAKLAGRFDRNFVVLEQAIVELRKQRAPKPPRRIRHGSAARMDPDDYRAGRVILAAVVIFAAAMGSASFFGQIGFAPNTQLPSFMWWVIPVAIDLPLTVLGWVRLIFRRRKQSAKRTVFVMFLLTGVSSMMNVLHVLEGAGIFAGTQLTVPIVAGATVMGLIPFLIVYAWEEITKLLVKPVGEKRDPDAAAAPQRKSTRKTARRSTKR